MERGFTHELCTPCVWGLCSSGPGNMYVTGGAGGHSISNDSGVEKYLPSRNTWKAVASLPQPRTEHSTVAIDLAMYAMRLGCGRVLQHIMPESRYQFAARDIGGNIFVFAWWLKRTAHPTEVGV